MKIQLIAAAAFFALGGGAYAADTAMKMECCKNCACCKDKAAPQPKDGEQKPQTPQAPSAPSHQH